MDLDVREIVGNKKDVERKKQQSNWDRSNNASCFPLFLSLVDLRSTHFSLPLNRTNTEKTIPCRLSTPLSLSLSLAVPLCVSQSQVFLFGIITKRPKNVLQVTTLQRPKGNNVIIALITTRPKCVY